MLATISKGLHWGGAVGGITYAYSKLGEQGKLCQNCGYFSPAKHGAFFVGASAGIIAMLNMSPIAKAGTFACSLCLLTWKANSNSIRELETMQKTDDFFRKKHS